MPKSTIVALLLLSLASTASVAQVVNQGPYASPTIGRGVTGPTPPPNVFLPQSYQAPATAQEAPQTLEPVGQILSAPVASSSSLRGSVGIGREEESFGTGPVEIDGHARIIDSGTILVDRKIVALQGLSGPVSDAVCLDMTGLSFRCGERAARRLEQIVEGKRIRCEATVVSEGTVPEGTCRDGRTDIAKVLVRDGWAVSSGAYAREEEEARRNRRGMWSGFAVDELSRRRVDSYPSKSGGKYPSILDSTPRSDSFHAWRFFLRHATLDSER